MSLRRARYLAVYAATFLLLAIISSAPAAPAQKGQDRQAAVAKSEKHVTDQSSRGNDQLKPESGKSKSENKGKDGNKGKGSGASKPKKSNDDDPPATPTPAQPPAEQPVASDPGSGVVTPAPADGKQPRREPRGNGRSPTRTEVSAGDSGAITADAAASTGAGSSATKARDRRSKPAGRAPTVETNVVARLVEYVPGWVRWALAGLATMLLGMALALVHEFVNRRRAEHAALSDPLTGVANRLAFEQRLTEEWQRTKRFGRSFSVLVIDLDEFKQINDKRGHSTGDRALRVVAQQMAQRVRDTDMLARIGGDEFAVICPETSAEGAAKLKHDLERQATGPADIAIAPSIGVAEFDPDDDRATAIVDRADAAMYEQKRQRAGQHTQIAIE